jgi:hypothetical protein
VGDVVPNHRAFARYFAYACHEDTPILCSGVRSKLATAING